MDIQTYNKWKALPAGEVSFVPFVPRSIYDITRDFVHSIDPEITITFYEDEFYAICSTKTVNITFRYQDEDSLFDAFVQKHFGVSINPILMGILHEVFHILTYDEQLDRERSILYYMLNIDFECERYKDFTNMYFAIPSEFEATAGGVNYYLTHKKECEDFLREVEPIIKWVNSQI